MNAYEYLLKLREWHWFGTLTWSDDRMGTPRSRECNVDAFLRTWCRKTAQVAHTALPICIRWELGEMTKRPHCHFLLHGFPAPTVTRNTGYQAARFWYRRYGIAEVRPWDVLRREQIVSYLFDNYQRENENGWVLRSANEYELGKFGDPCNRIVFNGALWDDLQRVSDVRFDVAQEA